MFTEKELYDQYIKQMEAESEVLTGNNEAFDKAILSLSSGILILSFAVFRFVVPMHEVHYLTVIEVSWGFLCCAIISNLVGYRVSNHFLEKKLRETIRLRGEFVCKVQRGDQNVIPEHSQEKSGLSVDVMNWMSGAFFVFALILMFIFMVTNTGSEISNKSKVSKTSQKSEVVIIVDKTIA